MTATRWQHQKYWSDRNASMTNFSKRSKPIYRTSRVPLQRCGIIMNLCRGIYLTWYRSRKALLGVRELCETPGAHNERKKLPEELFEVVWWASRESNTAPTDYAYQLRFSPPLSGLWSGLSLVFTTCPFSLYTFSLILSKRASLGIATLPRQQRFPRI